MMPWESEEGVAIKKGTSCVDTCSSLYRDGHSCRKTDVVSVPMVHGHPLSFRKIIFKV